MTSHTDDDDDPVIATSEVPADVLPPGREPTWTTPARLATSPEPPAADGAIADRLRAAGIPLTLQRLVVAQILLARPAHLSADQILAAARAVMPEISRATIYNTLKLLSEKHLVRELNIDAECTVYDSNTDPHHHLYLIETGELIDVPASQMKLVGAPDLPPGVELDAVEVIMRVRKKQG